jgi:UDP-GlcNAc:undecaprenyl-phosphate GlcNAc-1-phosphate transferase
MAGLAVALRFVPYSDRGRLAPRLVARDGRLLRGRAGRERLPVLVLEILKLRRLRAWQLRHADPGTTEHEIDVEVERELETGEFRALDPK